MTLHRDILIATDFSECSRHALDYGVALARLFGARIHLLYVAYVPKELIGDYVAVGDELIDVDVTEGRQQIERAIAEAEKKGVAGCTGEVLSGLDAAARIVERGNSGKYDLLVIGTHGRSGLKRLWVGSVAEHVIRRSQIPVVTVPLSAANAAPEDARP